MRNPIDTQLVTTAANALLKHVENVRNRSSKSQLFEDDDFVLLTLGLFTVPDVTRLKPKPIPLPHALFGEDAEICVFVKDPQEEMKKKFESLGIKAKIIGLDKLRKNYKQFEARRKLCGSYDLFFADDRIIPSLSSALGKAFFKKKKQPIALKMDKDIVAQITRYRSGTWFFLNGDCCCVKIGRVNQSVEELCANITSGLEHIVEKIPRRWKNIQSIHIKTTDSTALPIYNTLPQPAVRIPTASTSGKRKEAPEEEEAERKKAKRYMDQPVQDPTEKSTNIKQGKKKSKKSS